MSIKMAILLLFMFTFLMLNAYAILEPNEVPLKEGESIADKLLNASQGGGTLRVIDLKHTATPQQSRALHEDNLNWTPNLEWSPNPESLSTHTTPRASRTESQGLLNKRSIALMSDTAIASGSRTSSSPSTNIAAGTWSLDFSDTPPKQAELTLFQVEDQIFGNGNIKNKSNILMVSALGTVQNNQIHLGIASVGTISLYNLVMTPNSESGDLVSGNYKAYTPDGRTWEGKVQGKRALQTN